MKRNLFIQLIIIGILIASCNDRSKYNIVQGYIPIYADEMINSFQNLSTTPRALVHPGKIYIYNDYLLINESREGIHIYDNSNKKSPINLTFYKIPGCTDMAIKNSILYTNYGNGLLSFDISDPKNPIFKQYIKSDSASIQRPDPSSSVRNKEGYIVFKCPDFSKGEIVAWRLGEIEGKYCISR
ncbi:MAG: hypothetical protein J5I91_05290 [Bacteroidetes bacterium]|nr:hypothetical protein [Bacteroidota bacterium]